MAQIKKSTESVNKGSFVFSKVNYQLFIASLAIVVIGFTLMSGETDIYSFTKITLAPIVVVLGFAIGFAAILYRLKNILAIIEGLTEFLPVSSTGHMIIATALMGIQPSAFVKLFTIVIQLGTILSVLVLYYKRFFKTLSFYYKLIIAAIPASVLGLLFNDYIDALLESPLMVAVMLVVGGLVLLFVDKWFNKPTVEDSDKVSYKQAFMIGVYQCLALIPGTSRSASTIIGGMAEKLTRKAAAEFSFFLALPMMFGASAVKLLKFFKEGNTFTGEELNLLIIGNLIGFVVAIVAIKSFIGFLTKYGFKAFGWYRIIVGVIILALLLSGHSLQII